MRFRNLTPAEVAALDAQRAAEEVARQKRRRLQWGPGYRVNELMALPADDVRVALNANEQAAVAEALVFKTLVVPTPAVPPFTDRRVKIGPVPVFWGDPWVAHACSLSPTLLAQIEAAEAAHLTAPGQT